MAKRVLTVQEWADRWQRLYPGKRNPRTRRHVDWMTSGFVRAHGSKRLSDIDPLLAQEWAVAHPSDVRFLRLMFSKAVKAQLLGLNPWLFVEVEPARRERRPPTAEELEAMVAAARARRHTAPSPPVGRWWEHFADCLIFTAYTGLRGEEVERVQAAHVLGAGRLEVFGKRRAGETAPRRRVVALLGPGADALARQRPHVGRVWRAQKGGPLKQRAREGAYNTVARAAGVEGTTFHGLRKFCASWLLDQGASDMDVAIQLGHMDASGHADPTLVRSTYGHPTVEPALERLTVITRGVPYVGHGSAGSVADAAS